MRRSLFMIACWITALLAALGLGVLQGEWFAFVVYIGLGLCIGSMKANDKTKR